MDISIKELKKICQDTKRQKEENRIVAKIFYQRISIYFTKFFIIMNMSANQVTIISFFFVILSCFFFLSSDYWHSIIAVFFFQLYRVLDFSDGEVARYRTRSCMVKGTAAGTFLELIEHFWVMPAIIIILGFRPYPEIQLYSFPLLTSISAAISYFIINYIPYAFQKAKSQYYPMSTSLNSLKNINSNKIKFGHINYRYNITELSITLSAIMNILYIIPIFLGLLLPIVVIMTLIKNYQTLLKTSITEELL